VSIFTFEPVAQEQLYCRLFDKDEKMKDPFIGNTSRSTVVNDESMRELRGKGITMIESKHVLPLR